MLPKAPLPPGRWTHGDLPQNARVGLNTIVNGEFTFKRFYSELDLGLNIGDHGYMDGVHFAVGKQARIVIGQHCVFTNAVLLCELEIVIGNYVVIGWNATVADTDFHPIDPVARHLDAIACSPKGKGMERPPILRSPVVIEDDVWIGPNATILKGVRIGAASFIEAGSLVTKDVPPGSYVFGNPAQVQPGTTR